MNLLETVVPFAAAVFVIALVLAAWRLVRGPSACDRVLALDTLYMNTLALLILTGLRWRTEIYFEAALVIAMMGFIGTLVLAEFLRRGSIAE